MSKKGKAKAAAKNKNAGGDDSVIAKIPPINQPFGALKEMRAKMVAEGAVPPTSSVANAKRDVAPKPRKAEIQPKDEPEDALSFHRLMSGVVPLDHARMRVPRTESDLGSGKSADAKARRAEGEAAIAREVEDVREHLRTLVDDARFEVNDDGERVEGRRIDVAPDALRKLRRGQLPIDARLDLHGLDASEAHGRVEAFLRDKRASGERCVLIVHGKGIHSSGGFAVLRGEIAAWLSQGRCAYEVAAFATATRDDGGEGAVYVLLRR